VTASIWWSPNRMDSPSVAMVAVASMWIIDNLPRGEAKAIGQGGFAVPVGDTETWYPEVHGVVGCDDCGVIVHWTDGSKSDAIVGNGFFFAFELHGLPIRTDDALAHKIVSEGLASIEVVGESS
jgi:hypothetical protein